MLCSTQDSKVVGKESSKFPKKDERKGRRGRFAESVWPPRIQHDELREVESWRKIRSTYT